MRYAKYIDENTIQWAPANKIGGPGEPSYIPYPEELLKKDGYLEVYEEPCPGEPSRYMRKWSLREDVIFCEWIELPDLRTPAEKRQLAYETTPCIEYNEQVLTIDEAEKLYYQYFCELNKQELCSYLQTSITRAKNRIRNTYPDNPEV